MEEILITGGAGFIGSNVASNFIKKGEKVIIFDNLSRRGSDLNLKWLKSVGEFEFIKGDIRNYALLKRIFQKHKNIKVVFHEAAQVAVTTSIENPSEDFEINIKGTFNILETIRNFSPKSILIYASTNKVYGSLEDLRIIEKNKRYEFGNKEYKNGINENYCLDFHSPYGCSKGAADQYVRDYSRIYGLKTVVFRQSCIYGLRQFGIEDQGWVAWFVISSLLNKNLTIYGNGKQVRDILFITDLISAYELALENIDKTAGKIYNIGGGLSNAISLLELIDILEKLMNKKIDYKISKTRPGDQKIFISNIIRADKDFNWKPKISINNGVKKLYNWILKNKNEIINFYGE